MLKFTNRYSYYNKQIQSPRAFHEYVSDSFNPLPPLRTRTNELSKRIRFSSKVSMLSTPKETVKLPNIVNKSSNNVRQKRDKRNIDSRRTSFMKNGGKIKSIMKNKNYVSDSTNTFDADFDDDLNEYDSHSPVIVNLEEDDKENIEEEIEKLRKDKSLELHHKKTPESGNSKASEDDNDDINEVNSDILSDDSDILEKVREKQTFAIDLKKQAVKNKFRKIVLMNKSIGKLKEDNILLNMKKSYVNSDDPFGSPEYNINTAEDPLRTLKLRFGSSLSEDGNYTMLKCYEDMLCNEIQHIYPKKDSNEISRTKTSTFIRLPRKFESSKASSNNKSNANKLQHSISTSVQGNYDNYDDDLVELKKHKIRVSKQLEKAMIIIDSIKKRKGEAVGGTDGANADKIKNVFNAYEVWTHNWKKLFAS